MTTPHDATTHWNRVADFTRLLKVKVPDTPDAGALTEKRRILRAKLIMEEVLEMIERGLGVQIDTLGGSAVTYANLDFGIDPKAQVDLVELLDGACDASVVITGTLAEYGIRDAAGMEAVDLNNLAKFGPGHHFRDDGKLIKPPGHTKPDLEAVLVAQGWNPAPQKAE